MPPQDFAVLTVYRMDRRGASLPRTVTVNPGGSDRPRVVPDTDVVNVGARHDPSRRRLLTLGMGLLATACSAPSAADGPARPASGSPGPTGAPAPKTLTELAERISGPVLTPDAPGYPAAALSSNPRYDTIQPAAVVQCASAADVATVIRYARDTGTAFSVRSGGHSYPGWSTGTGLVLDLSRMAGVTVGPAAATVTAGPGARLIDVYRATAAAGVGIPAGSCPTVGLGGQALGGGQGVLGRLWGLTCDVVTSYQLVTADGRILEVDENTEPDLFFAGRGGGGGSFGVVTALHMAARPVPPVTTFFLQWPFTAAAAVVSAWQAWAPGADDRLWSTCKLLARAGAVRVFVAGTWTGDPGSLDTLLTPLHDAVGVAPTANGRRTPGYLAAMESEAGCTGAACSLPPRGTATREALAATSHVPANQLPAGAVSALVDGVAGLVAPPGLREAGVSLDALGGAIGRVDPAATAFVHRRSPFVVQYTATWDDPSRSGAPFDALVRGLRARLTPTIGNAAYVNYPDAALTDPAQAYWGDNYARLQRTKRAVDPDDVFTFPQAVRP